MSGVSDTYAGVSDDDDFGMLDRAVGAPAAAANEHRCGRCGLIEDDDAPHYQVCPAVAADQVRAMREIDARRPSASEPVREPAPGETVIGPCHQCGYQGEIVACPDETGPTCRRCSDAAPGDTGRGRELAEGLAGLERLLDNLRRQMEPEVVARFTNSVLDAQRRAARLRALADTTPTDQTVDQP